MMLTILLATSSINAQYTLTNDDVVVEDGVLKSFSNTNEKNIIIPSSLDGQVITSIGENAFSLKYLIAVKLPSTIDSIGKLSFYYNNLDEISIPKSVVFIGENAFGSNNVTDMMLPKPEIDGFGFMYWNDTILENTIVTDFSISYTANMQEIYTLNDNDVIVSEGKIISYNGNEKYIIIPEILDGQSITSIGDDAFKSLDLLGVTLPNGVVKIGAYSFAYNNIKEIFLGNKLEEIGDNAFQTNKIIRVELSNSVTSIGSRSFSGNEIPNIYLPSSVVYIGEYAFSGNILSEFTLPIVDLGEGTRFIDWTEASEHPYPIIPGGTEVTDLISEYYANIAKQVDENLYEIENGVITRCNSNRSHILFQKL